jgi:hypothetical protein
VRSFIAALRTLVLPWGATSGQRIVLNGVLGRIEIYAADGSLFITLDDDGIVVYDPTPDIRQIIASSTDFATHTFFDTNGAYACTLGYEAIPGGDDHRSFFIQSPDTDKGILRFFLHTPKGTNTKNPMMQFDTGFIDPAVTAVPMVDLTGFTGALAAQTVVADLELGVSNGAGNSPTITRSLPRGTIGIATRNTDLTFSTTAGTQTDIVVTSALPVQAGRRYRVTFDGGLRILTGGSGFAANDAWTFELTVDEGAGFISLNKVPRRGLVSALVAAAASLTVPTLIGYHDAAADGTMTFKARGTKSSGAATVTSTLGAAGGAAASGILVEDIGAAV